MNFAEEIMEASKRIKDPNFIELNALFDNYEKTLCVEILDGFNHTWFYQTYSFKDNRITKYSILKKLMNDTQDFDMFEELGFYLKEEVPGMPCVRTMCKVAFNLEHFTNELYWQLRTLAIKYQ